MERTEEPANLHKHEGSLRNGRSRFDDSYAITQRDVTFEDEERWITVGAIGPGSILLVVHTFMRNTTKKSFVSSRLALPNRTKESLMRKLTRSRNETSELSPQKETRTLISRTLRRLSIGAEPKLASSIDQRRKPVTMRLDSGRHRMAESRCRGYQTKANWLLRQAIDSSQ